MRSVELEIKENGKDIFFKAQETESGHVGQIITGIFSMLGVPASYFEEKSVVEAPVAVTTPVKEVSVEPEASNLIEQPKAETVKHLPNPTEIIATPITMEEVAEMIIESDEPSYFKTGIKVKDGINHYKARYICTKCGHKGNHYIPEGVEFVDCHECQTSLLVKKATPGTQGIQKDRFGNWYVAGAQLPVHEFVYGKTSRVNQ